MRYSYVPAITGTTGLPFKAYGQFKKADLEERSVLYRMLAERIWNPDDLLQPVQE